MIKINLNKTAKAIALATVLSMTAAPMYSTLGSVVYAEDTGEAKEVETVEAEIDNATIKVEGTAQITATGKDSEGKEVADAVFTYASDDDDIATVSEAGLVTGVAEGTATITVTSNEKTATVKVTVEPKKETEEPGKPEETKEIKVLSNKEAKELLKKVPAEKQEKAEKHVETIKTFNDKKQSYLDRIKGINKEA